MYKSRKGTNMISQKSNEESVTNAIPILRPIVEKDSFLDLSLSMAFENHISTSIPDTQPMIFNVRLVFARTNIHDGQRSYEPLGCEN